MHTMMHTEARALGGPYMEMEASREAAAERTSPCMERDRTDACGVLPAPHTVYRKYTVPLRTLKVYFKHFLDKKLLSLKVLFDKTLNVDTPYLVII